MRRLFMVLLYLFPSMWSSSKSLPFNTRDRTRTDTVEILSFVSTANWTTRAKNHFLGGYTGLGSKGIPFVSI